MTGTTDREPSFWIIKHGGCSPSNNWICLHSNRLTHFIRENPDSLGVQLLEVFYGEKSRARTSQSGV